MGIWPKSMSRVASCALGAAMVTEPLVADASNASPLASVRVTRVAASDMVIGSLPSNSRKLTTSPLFPVMVAMPLDHTITFSTPSRTPTVALWLEARRPSASLPATTVTSVVTGICSCMALTASSLVRAMLTVTSSPGEPVTSGRVTTLPARASMAVIRNIINSIFFMLILSYSSSTRHLSFSSMTKLRTSTMLLAWS